VKIAPPGVGWWVGPPDASPGASAWSEHDADVVHHAASTVKVAVLVAAARAGLHTSSEPVAVHAGFASAIAGRAFDVVREEDDDEDVWHAVDASVPVRWLVERMVTRSSNLATDLVLERTGLDPVRAVLRDAGCGRTAVDRFVDDGPAAAAGLALATTPHDLALLLGALVGGRLLDDAATAHALGLLRANEHADDVVAGLPPGTDVAHKNGWDVVAGRTVRHSVALVTPPDAAAYVQAVCTTTDLPDADARALLAHLTAGWWERRRIR
jgi:beta-lactamase class A